jgi:Fucose 4-O-acetylase and related acetyltransferases
METAKNRLLYIDNLRLLMIVFVIMLHLGVTYSGFGMWYYKEGAPISFASSVFFGFYLSLTQGYFMGFLFLIAGYFVPGAYDKKGCPKFVKDRLIRLGIPALIYILIVNPLMLYYQLGVYNNSPDPTFLKFYLSGYIGNFSFLSGTGPMWFAVALLIFTLIYGLIRSLYPIRHENAKIPVQPTAKAIWLLIFLISVSAFLIRTVQPIGTSILNMQLCYFAQYVILFVVGILAYRYDLFQQLRYNTGKKWLIFGVLFGFVSWGVLMITGGALEGMKALNGGFTWQSALYSLWESFIAVSIDVGLLAVFKEKLNRQSKFVKKLSENSFAVYVFHPPIITAAAMLFLPVALPPTAKFAVMCVVCLPLCFLAAHFIARRIPFLKHIL